MIGKGRGEHYEEKGEEDVGKRIGKEDEAKGRGEGRKMRGC